MSKFNQTCWKFALSHLVCVVKFLDQSKMYWFFVSQSKFKSSIWVHQTALDGCNFGSLYFLHSMFVFNKVYWFIFPFKSSYCGNIFMSIQVVLNIWEQFEVIPTFLDYSELQWLVSSSYSLYFQYIKIEKVAHTSLVCVFKISYQSKKLGMIEKHFNKRR